jgi:phenylpropionate dioxygenase-like ring-hydroxylating dioxygenase large terminal subunit
MSINKDDWYISSSPAWDNPKIKGHKLEGNIYTSKEVLQKELDYLWPNVWLLMGRADEIPDAGDYQMEELGRESFIMVRQNDLSIKIINKPLNRVDV